MKMNSPRQISHSPIYREFRAIEGMDWRTVRRFYEEYESEIRNLEFHEYFELLLAYSTAIFEIGLYEKYLDLADTIIEISITRNIKFFHGQDVFLKTLFRKAASNFHLYQFEKSEYILREILRIDPYDEDAAQLLKDCLRKMSPPFVRQTRAIAMSLFLFSAVVICFEMLAIRIFYESYIETVEIARSIIFIVGIIVLGGGELLHRWRGMREVNGFVNVLRERRK